MPDEALALAREIGYPLVVRPSYVLGGRAMEVVYSDADLRATSAMRCACRTIRRCCSTASSTTPWKSTSTVIADAEGNVLIGGIMEHIEEAGVHSGDSSCSLPPYSLSPTMQDRLREQVRAMARR
jgi:carbamoyl-phosphate synthase large subunit